MTAVRWDQTALDGMARTGTLSTPHGPVPTPAFMPVGTRGTVRAVDFRDLAEVGARVLLANTYHLMLRPGSETVERLGGLHAFMGWDGPILTDSGGYQVFSLAPAVEEEGLRFRSGYDGSLVELTPEEAVRVQEQLGADIAMTLDVLVGLPSPPEVVAAAMERTLRWAERSLAAHRRPDQGLFGIIQGGVDVDLRRESARRTAALGFAGFGVGGLSVGESSADRNAALESVFAELPAGKVRYVMGLGDAEGVVEAIARGADLFDCVWPTRLARHGKVLTTFGDFSIKRSEFAASTEPLEEGCSCLTCSRYTRGYLRHLRRSGELLGFRLITIHNLAFTFRLLAGARRAIGAGRFDAFRKKVAEQRRSL